MVLVADKKPKMIHRGKVRNTFPGDDPSTLLQEVSDRISVFDFVLNQPIPGKGEVLARMSEHWFTMPPILDVMPNHYIGGPMFSRQQLPKWAEASRSLLVKRLDMLPVEAIVRGNITGSGWKDYQASGQVSGIILPPGLQEMEQFPKPIFTPSTKAEIGHDENIDFEDMVEILGNRRLAEQIRAKSIEVYEVGAQMAREKGIILVDTKLELGIDPITKKLTLADEVLTPDSSRFVAEEDYEIGKPPVSMDKQFVRDWILDTGWDKDSPPPDMPQEVIEETRKRYHKVSLRLTGESPIRL